MEKIFFFLIFVVSEVFSQRKRPNLQYIDNLLKESSDSLKVMLNKEGMPVLVATRDINKNDILIKLNPKYIITSYEKFPLSQHFGKNLLNKTIDSLAGKILYTLSNQKNDMSIYLNSLMMFINTVNGPQWDNETFNYYKQNLIYKPNLVFDKDILTAKIKKIKESVLNSDFRDHYQAEDLEESKLKNIYSLIYKYGMEINYFQILNANTYKSVNMNQHLDKTFAWTLLPLISLAKEKYQPFAKTYIPKDIFDLNENKVQKILINKGIKNFEKIYQTCESFDSNPIFDEFVLSEPNSMKGFLQFNKGSINLHSNQDYKRGDQIVYQYSKRANSEYLIREGQLGEINPFEQFSITLNSNAYKKELIKIALEEFGAIIQSGENLLFQFNFFQLNHNFEYFLRIYVLTRLMNESEILGNKSKIIEIVKSRKFANPFRELELWDLYKNSFQKQQQLFQGKLQNDIQKIDQNTNKVIHNIQRLVVLQKEIIYKHLNYATKKMSQIYTKRLLFGFWKKVLIDKEDLNNFKDDLDQQLIQ